MRISDRLNVVLITLLLPYANCAFSQELPSLITNCSSYNRHVILGIPNDGSDENDFLIFRKQYVLSYNYETNTANWVGWNLNKYWYGEIPRYSGSFITDTTLPPHFDRIGHADYTHSGYDRGHLVRSAERTMTPEDNISTFILSNIIPQTPELNRGPWVGFEYWCEEQCKSQDRELFIYSGGVYSDSSKYIKNRIRIPDACFKIVVVLKRQETADDISESTEIVAVIMPNDFIKMGSWQNYLTSIDEIEKATGYDFLSNVRDDIEVVLERKIRERSE